MPRCAIQKGTRRSTTRRGARLALVSPSTPGVPSSTRRCRCRRAYRRGSHRRPSPPARSSIHKTLHASSRSPITRPAAKTTTRRRVAHRSEGPTCLPTCLADQGERTVQPDVLAAAWPTRYHPARRRRDRACVAQHVDRHRPIELFADTSCSQACSRSASPNRPTVWALLRCLVGGAADRQPRRETSDQRH
jgi:hypothetical protein